MHVVVRSHCRPNAGIDGGGLNSSINLLRRLCIRIPACLARWPAIGRGLLILENLPRMFDREGEIGKRYELAPTGRVIRDPEIDIHLSHDPVVNEVDSHSFVPALDLVRKGWRFHLESFTGLRHTDHWKNPKQEAPDCSGIIPVSTKMPSDAGARSNQRDATRVRVASVLWKGLEPKVGIEPTTYGLRNRCSTTELLWHPLASAKIGDFPGTERKKCLFEKLLSLQAARRQIWKSISTFGFFLFSTRISSPS